MKTTTLSKDTKRNLIKTIAALLAVILTMAIVFNFELNLKYSSEGTKSANVVLWPIKQFVELLVFKWFGMAVDNRWSHVLEFFLTDVPYVFLIIFIFSYTFNFARSFSTDEELAAWMKNSKGFLSRVIGAVAGFVSPFCSCSTIPVMTTLARSRAPFSTVMAFLITSPMINEAGIALMWSYFGYKIALIYMGFGFVIGILGSYIASWFGFTEKAFQDKILEKSNEIHIMKFRNSFKRMHKMGVMGMKKMVKQIWWILIIALMVGAIMHGWIPESWIKNNIGSAWWGPLALIPIGLLMYLNISATLPIVNSFVGSGLNIGTGMGFLMAVNTVSLPEMIMLSKIFKKKFMAFFITYLFIAIIIFSYMMLFIPQASLLT